MRHRNRRGGNYDVDQPWESCITICNQWSWKPDDKLKSLDECLSTLIKTVGGGGNLLLNVGPMPDGRIEPRQAERLREIGQWLSKNGEAIYGTKGGPYKPTNSIASTRKDNAIYIHLINFRGKELSLPFPFDAKVIECSWLNGEKLPVTQKGDSVIIDLKNSPGESINVVKISLSVDTENFKTVEMK